MQKVRKGKKVNNKKKLLALVIALCTTAISGCADKNNGTQNSIAYYDESNSYSQSPEGVENSNGNVVREEDKLENIPTVPAKANEKVNVAGMDVTFTNVYDLGMLEPNQFVKNRRQALAFVCEVTNNTDTTVTVNGLDFKIRILDGESVTTSMNIYEMTAAREQISNLELINSELKPGETVKGYAPLTVSPDWKTLTVYYTPYSLGINDSVTFEVTPDMLERPS